MDYYDILEKFWNATRDNDERSFDELPQEDLQKLEKDYIAEKKALEQYYDPYTYWGVAR
jgi:hypothetical protein